MAETRLADVIVPEVFTQYVREASIYKSRFARSGILENSSLLSQLLGGGGTTFNIPFWQHITNIGQGATAVPSETVATTINNITADKQVGVRLLRERAWGANDLSALLAGDDPIAAIVDGVSDYWAQAIDLTLVSTVVGVIADNKANDSGDLVNASGAQFSDDGVIDAQALLGENGTVGRTDLNGGDYIGIAVHPDIYALMRKQDLITFVPVSDQIRPIPTYMGMTVVVDRNMPETTGTYTSIIFKSNALGYGENGNRIEETELYRDPSLGMGIDQIYTRKNYIVHPYGFASTVTPAGVAPTDAELEAATSWNRVYAKENIGFVAYEATLS
jgi:hypothetical protein